MIETLFSIDAFVHRVKEWKGKKQKLLKFINTQDFFRRPPTSFETTRYGNNTYKNNNQAFGKLFMNVLHKEFKIFSKESGFKRIELMDVWAVKYKQHDHQIVHHHGRVMYAGILYLNLTKEQDTTTYVAPFPSEMSGTTRLSKIDCKEGTLVIVPAHLLHFVKPNPIKKERIILSFDMNCFIK